MKDRIGKSVIDCLISNSEIAMVEMNIGTCRWRHSW